MFLLLFLLVDGCRLFWLVVDGYLLHPLCFKATWQVNFALLNALSSQDKSEILLLTIFVNG